MLKLKFSIVFFLLLFSRYVTAQINFSAKTWHFIDTSIEKKRNLGNLLLLINELEQKAIAGEDYFNYARCLNYKILVKDLKTEDTLYFKNSAFLDTLLQQKQLPVRAQYALHIMAAKRLLFFIPKYKKFNQNRYERKDLPLNYAAFTNAQLDSIATLHFETAKALAKQINSTTVDNALWLAPDPLQFLFKPGLFDIAIAAQINSVAIANRNVNSNEIKHDWLTLAQDAFIQKIDSSGDDITFRILNLYHEWLVNKEPDASAYYFIETLARKYFYSMIKSGYGDAEKIYEQYLRQLLLSPYNTVKAHAVYQLFLLLKNQGEKYFPGSDYSYRQYHFSAWGNYDTAFRFHPAKALSLFTENKHVLDSFYYLKNILQQMEEQIRSVDLQFSMQTNNLPNEPLLGELKFKNAGQLFYNITRISDSDSLPYNDEMIPKLLLKPAVATGSIALPVNNDFNYHNSYVKLDALQPGNYRMLFADKKLADTGIVIRSVPFTVTNIAVINNDQRVYILNRKTGMPLYGAKVQAGYSREIKRDSITTQKYISDNYVVNKNGYVLLRNTDYTRLTVQYGNDSLTTENISFPDKEEPEDIYTKEDYEDLLEYYDEQATAYVYTDRSIYRPGQTVYYKAIFITKNPKTGEPMLMSRENLKGKLFGNVYKKWLKEEDPWMVVKDAFNKEIDTIKIVPNEFGSVSGSFKIPKTAATGEWEIGPDYIDMDWQYGRFKVEEYKRPSYEISIDKPKKELRIKDDFSFKVRVRSFAGAMLNNVKLNYTLYRNGHLPVPDSIQMKMVKENKPGNILTATGYTNAAGELEIFVSDSLLKNYTLADSVKWNFEYMLKVETVDATGESYDESASINISSEPVRIKFSLAPKLNRAELPQIMPIAEDQNAGIVNKNVRIRFYKTTGTEKLYTKRKLTRADEWVYDKEMLQQWFPQVDLYLGKAEVEKKLVWETTVNTGLKEKIVFPVSIFVAGNYVAEAVYEENGKILGELSRKFSVFDVAENKLPEQEWDFSSLVNNSVNAGDSIKYYFGSSAADNFSIFHIVYYSGKKKRSIAYNYEEYRTAQGLQLYKLKIPDHAVDVLQLTQVFILNNQLFTNEERIFINNNKVLREPGIIIEKYRKNLTPGSKETFTVSIKTQNENIAAELMTTMYDASLDKLEKHSWRIPRTGRSNYLSTDWTTNINSDINSRNNVFYNKLQSFSYPSRSTYSPLWWLSPLDYSYEEPDDDQGINRKPGMNGTFYFSTSAGLSGGLGLVGRVAGISMLSESVVTSAYNMKRMASSTSTILIRGTSSLSSYKQPLVILDGVIYEGDLGKIDPKAITQGLVLKGADASAIYGSRAAQGVLILSTKGDIVFPKEPEPVIIPRKNFNESAFFFPAIHADKNGFYSFSFTMPETVTEWNWKMLAHTKLNEFVYAERKLHTQLPLMVQPNMPRLLYQGDRIILQSRISNTDTLPAAGKIFCTIEDVVTGDDITNKLVAINQQEFSLNKKENKTAAFEIKIPAQQLNPIKIIVKISSANFTDGEEHIIPILSPKLFVRQSQPFYFKNNTDTILKTAVIPANSELYGVGVSINPKPQAALLNALPWLAGYPYGCAEQTFNKLLANAIALKLMQTDKMVQQSFSAAKLSIDLDKNVSQKLPDELNEETMPWLNKANQSSLLKQRLFTTLDTSKTLISINELLLKIYKLQSDDGGTSWFSGGKSNFYISNYLLRGFGLMNKDSLCTPGNSVAVMHTKFIEQLVKYCDKEFTRLLTIDKMSRPDLLYYAYARSYWQKQNPVSDSLLKNMQAYLHDEWKTADKKNLYDQSLLIIASLRFANGNQDLIIKLLAQLNSIRQLAILDEQNGMRWKELADEDDLNISAEETIALIAEAFKEAGNDEMIRNGIVTWLLTAKNEHHWSSTKATAAAIGMLIKNNKSAIGETQTITATVAEKNMMVTDDMLSGLDYNFSNLHSMPAFITLKKQTTPSASGNLFYYYFTGDSSLSNLNKNIQLDKKMYKWNNELSTWNLIGPGTVLKIADKVQVILTVTSSRALPFIFIDDKRAAAFEPTQNSSGYEYANGVSYYRSIRDAGYQFFAENIPSGRHEIIYEVKVSQEGNFTSGPAVLQCMYKPEATAYSNSLKIVTAH